VTVGSVESVETTSADGVVSVTVPRGHDDVVVVARVGSIESAPVVVSAVPVVPASVVGSQVESADSSVVTFVVADKDGAPLADQEVVVTVGSVESVETTSADGVVSVTVPRGHDDVVVVARVGSIESAPMVVAALPARIPASVTGKQDAAADPAIVTFTVTDAQNQPLANQAVTITVGGLSFTGHTSNDGIVTVAVTKTEQPQAVLATIGDLRSEVITVAPQDAEAPSSSELAPPQAWEIIVGIISGLAIVGLIAMAINHVKLMLLPPTTPPSPQKGIAKPATISPRLANH
ncbi:hypothetical protein, partial [Corynebacterium sp. ES2775-CONJ]|uniref:hypothetical protein n=1 Tax=Corynebacterium sp. ES2775-CONJ TaxID=2974029 RepID=UPI0021670591